MPMCVNVRMRCLINEVYSFHGIGCGIVCCLVFFLVSDQMWN